VIGNPVAGTLADHAAATTTDIPYPASPAAGDLLVFALFLAATSVTTPGGWTLAKQEFSTGTTSPMISVMYKVATGSESGNLTVTHASGTAQGQMWKISGVDQATPMDVAATSISAGAVATYVIPSLTTTMINTLLMAFGVTNNATATWAPPSGFTEILDSLVRNPSSNANYKQQAASGATGTVTVDASTTVKGAGILIALRRDIPTASGTIVVTSGLVGNAQGLFAVSGTIAVVSGLVGDATKSANAASGTIAVVSNLVGNPQIVLGAPNVIPVVSNLVGNVTAKFQVSGTIPVVSALVGNAQTKTPASGTITVVSGLVGAVTARDVASGAIPVVSALVGSVTARMVVAGTIPCVVTLSGNPTIAAGAGPKAASGTIAVVCVLHGNVTNIGPVVLVRLRLDRGFDDHGRTQPNPHQIAYPLTQTALLLFHDGTVIPVRDLEGPLYFAADAVVGGGHDSQFLSNAWEAHVLADAGYVLEPVT
jgi:hypothetical protein